MELENLQAFVSVARLQSFTRAAEELFLTQSAVSKRVALLEQQLDTRLFDRIGHKTRLTEAGSILLERAEKILLDVEDSRRVIRNLDQRVSGLLNLGTSHHIGLHRLPPVLKQFTQEYPDVELGIEFLDSEKACQMVEHGELELGIVTLPLSPAPVLETRKIWEDKLLPVISRQHPLAKKKKITLKHLAEVDAILPATGTFTRSILERALNREGLVLKSGMSTNYLETIKMLVSVGLGWTVLPETMIDRDLKALPIRALTLSRPLGLVTHVEHTLSNAAHALIRGLTAGSN